ncbi:uncharacterized protein [Drosophila bipectinata]|uniref:uncharacterized protein n=1 Tax=Drosophila bipectinata TaxID=42026 RepID=UPI0038B41915
MDHNINQQQYMDHNINQQQYTDDNINQQQYMDHNINQQQYMDHNINQQQYTDHNLWQLHRRHRRNSIQTTTCGNYIAATDGCNYNDGTGADGCNCNAATASPPPQTVASTTTVATASPPPQTVASTTTAQAVQTVATASPPPQTVASTTTAQAVQTVATALPPPQTVAADIQKLFNGRPIVVEQVRKAEPNSIQTTTCGNYIAATDGWYYNDGTGADGCNCNAATASPPPQTVASTTTVATASPPPQTVASTTTAQAVQTVATASPPPQTVAADIQKLFNGRPIVVEQVRKAEPNSIQTTTCGNYIAATDGCNYNDGTGADGCNCNAATASPPPQTVASTTTVATASPPPQTVASTTTAQAVQTVATASPPPQTVASTTTAQAVQTVATALPPPQTVAADIQKLFNGRPIVVEQVRKAEPWVGDIMTIVSDIPIQPLALNCDIVTNCEKL